GERHHARNLANQLDAEAALGGVQFHPLRHKSVVAALRWYPRARIQIGCFRRETARMSMRRCAVKRVRRAGPNSPRWRRAAACAWRFAGWAFARSCRRRRCSGGSDKAEAAPRAIETVQVAVLLLQASAARTV